MRSIAERTSNHSEALRRMTESSDNNLRVAIPGIIESFDAVEQVAIIQPAIRERIIDPDGNLSFVELPLLLDVPIVIPHAGSFYLTFPVQQGDECLVIFADMCIDAWWANGGIQNQVEKRRHDLSDAFAILGCWSQPNRLSNYNQSAAQLRNKAGTSYIQLSDNEIDIVSATVKINGVAR